MQPGFEKTLPVKKLPEDGNRYIFPVGIPAPGSEFAPAPGSVPQVPTTLIPEQQAEPTRAPSGAPISRSNPTVETPAPVISESQAPDISGLTAASDQATKQFLAGDELNAEMELTKGEVAQQVIRPTGLLDPVVEVRGAQNQVDDLPAPVAPATSRCGILARFAQIKLPSTSLPRAITIGWWSFPATLVRSTSPRETISLSLFGISIPTADFPGIGERILTSLLATA